MNNAFKFLIAIILSFTFFITVFVVNDMQPQQTKTTKFNITEPIETLSENNDVYYSNNLLIRFTKTDLQCLQANIFFEARNQSKLGKIAVAQVTLNRVKSKRFPNTVCGVVTAGKKLNGKMVKHKCAFSWYCDGASDRPNLKNKLEHEKWVMAHNIALAMLSGELTLDNNATHYHTTTSNPYWSNHPSMTKLVTIGDHIFYKENQQNI